jgi:hypothetical protein
MIRTNPLENLTRLSGTRAYPLSNGKTLTEFGKEKDRPIKKQGAKDGSFGITSGETLSDTENKILADAHEYQHGLAHKGDEYFEKLESRINS